MNAVQAAAVNTLKYSQGTYSAGGDAIDWSYYDTNPVPSAAGQVRYFVNPIGAGGKTIADTNMIAAGQIPKAQKHVVTHLKSFYTSVPTKGTAQVASFYTLLKQTVVEFIIANKYYYGQWTLQELFGVAVLFAMTPTTAGDNIPLISPRFHGIFPFNTPIELAENTNFELKVTYTATPGTYLPTDLLMLSMYGKLSYAT
jgi:hypothetical protein